MTDADLDRLKFFRTVRCQLDGAEVWISRTGYTGDLGYEIWVERDDAEPVYDALMAAGRAYGILPAGLTALDVTRVEAGFIMNGVDYFSAHHCLTEMRKNSPYELGLGWTVQLTGAALRGPGRPTTREGAGFEPRLRRPRRQLGPNSKSSSPATACRRRSAPMPGATVGRSTTPRASGSARPPAAPGRRR